MSANVIRGTLDQPLKRQFYAVVKGNRLPDDHPLIGQPVVILPEAEWQLAQLYLADRIEWQQSAMTNCEKLAKAEAALARVVSQMNFWLAGPKHERAYGLAMQRAIAEPAKGVEK